MSWLRTTKRTSWRRFEFSSTPRAFEVATANSPPRILSSIEQADFDAVLMDLNYARDTTSGGEGMDLLTQIRRLDATLPVLVMTAWGSVDGAVEAMRRGARDYLEKPWDNERLLKTLRTQVELGRALRRGQHLEDENRWLRGTDEPDFIAESKAMKPVLRVMERVGPSEANVLITGEHGTGKEVVARWIHAVSERAKNTLVSVNAGGFSEGLFESELFGHVKGAFTDAKADRIGFIELAHQGTLFLDEIANISLQQQAKLLRVLETGEIQRVGSSKIRKVDVRILAATNADLTEIVAAGEFREDLLYRLNTVEIRLPPLRERSEDIETLAQYFLERHRARYRNTVDGFAEDAMRALPGHSWPGNVRELEHSLERAVLMAQGDLIHAEDLGLTPRADGGVEMEQLTLDEAERVLIEKALDRSGGNVSRAADELGLSRSALYRRLQRYGLGVSGSTLKCNTG